jgi:glycyl-tRNA synthetase beta chain
LGILDRLDTLVGFFARGKMPKGSKDPFALRRAAAGCVSLLLKQSSPLPVSDLLEKIFALYNAQGHLKGCALPLAPIADFLKERLRFFWKAGGRATSILEAALGAHFDDPWDLKSVWGHALALEAFFATPSGQDIRALTTRVQSILKAERAKGPLPEGLPDEGVMTVDAERHTWQAFCQLPRPLTLAGLGSLRSQVDAFFASVTVNDPLPSVRDNRLKLLKQVEDSWLPLGDFSKIEDGL